MTMQAKPVAHVQTRREPCPECHEECGWCSWHRWQAREMGCGSQPRGRRRRFKCEKAEAIKGTECGTCDGSREITVRREIIR